MIHEVSEKIFDLPLQDYTLTFDDGLYSQYYYFDRFKSIPTEKIFFISSNIVCEGQQSTGFPPSAVAHEKAFFGNKEDYMTVEQIKELMKDPLVSIGGHSHYHKNIKDVTKITQRLKFFLEDTKLMMDWFQANLGFKPHEFCFPYNNDYRGTYQLVLKSFGIVKFYGSERIPVETLLSNQIQTGTHDTLLVLP
jgi:Polysaccharide deacetylase